MLPGPIGALRELATVLGLLLVVAALWMPAAAAVRARVPLSILVALLYAGSALALGAQLYAALHGMYGTQIVDMRADALPVFVAKHCRSSAAGRGAARARPARAPLAVLIHIRPTTKVGPSLPTRQR